MVVDMTWAEVHSAHNFGLNRLIANDGNKDRKHYDRKVMTSDRLAQPAAVLAEMAAAKMLNVYYHPTLWPSSEHWENKSAADIGGLIEVRRVRLKEVGPGVRSSDKGRVVIGVYVPDSIEDDWRTPFILGWVEIAPNATRDDFVRDFKECVTKDGKKFFRCPVSRLTQPTEKNISELRTRYLTSLERGD
jgi:hypothetical protein